MKRPGLVLAITVWTSLASCAGNKDTVLPSDGTTMKSIYTRHFSDIGMRDTHEARDELNSRVLASGEGDLAGYTRDAYNELNLRFPRLPNPTLVMYVFPHLAGREQVPVPGYATTFPMYREVHYALPGEATAADDSPQLSPQ